MQGKPFKVKCDIYWAHFDTPNPMSDKGEFTVDLCNLSPEACKAIEAAGGSVRSREDKADQGNFITAKSKFAIEPMNTQGEVIKSKVGNGSKAIVLLSPWAYNWRGKTGVRFSPKVVTITDLVVYEAGGVVPETDDVL